jgi:hypothetical protein
METSGASAGLATMAFPGLVEGGLAKERRWKAKVILCGGFIVSRLFRARTTGSGPPGATEGATRGPRRPHREPRRPPPRGETPAYAAAVSASVIGANKPCGAPAPPIRAKLPEVGIPPPAVDVDTAVPVDDDLDVAFGVIRHGVGDTRPSDFAVVVRLVNQEHPVEKCSAAGRQPILERRGRNDGRADSHGRPSAASRRLMTSPTRDGGLELRHHHRTSLSRIGST